MTPFDLIGLARRAESVEELIKLAEQDRIRLSEEDAKIYFERWHGSPELSEDELDLVGGGFEEPTRGVCPFCKQSDKVGINVSGGGYYCYRCKRPFDLLR